MPTQLRKRKYPEPEKVITKRARQSFDSLDTCWELTPQHRKHFLRDIKCPELRKYHESESACKLFDDWVEGVAGSEYRLTFFNYYTVSLRNLPVRRYTQGLVTDHDILHRLAHTSITKKTTAELDVIPSVYNSWPPDFTFQGNILQSRRDRLELRNSIEMCIGRRILFRNKCVLPCSKRFNTQGHDLFLLILQTMRAKLLLQFND
jgi:hypothetical protein